MYTTVNRSCAHPARRRANPHLPRRQQHGSALIVGLVLLLVVTILAVAGMQDTLLQERMSGNWHDRNLAFQASEAALRGGEVWLEDPDHRAEAEDDHDPLDDPEEWEGDDPQPDNETVDLSNSEVSFAEDAAFHINPPSLKPVGDEDEGDVGTGDGRLCDRVFSIYGHGVGGTINARVILQTSVIPRNSVPVRGHPDCDE